MPQPFELPRRTVVGLGLSGLAVAIVAAIPAAVHAQATPASDSDVVRLLRETELARLRAFVVADMDVLAGLHSDDFQLINPSGGTLSKDEYLGGVAAGEIDYLVWEPTSDIAVREYGDAAAIRYQARTEIVVFGEPISVQTWHTDVYERRAGTWLVVWSQATALAP